MILRFVILASILVSSVARGESDYLRVATNYASALLTHGRDKGGPIRTPLVATALDRATGTVDGEDRKIG